MYKKKTISIINGELISEKFSCGHKSTYKTTISYSNLILIDCLKQDESMIEKLQYAALQARKKGPQANCFWNNVVYAQCEIEEYLINY